MPPKSTKKGHKPSRKEGQPKVVKKVTTKAVIAIPATTGRGDYRPTQFARVKGRGDYFGDLLGGLGSKLGSAAGNWIQGGFRKLTGMGDYRSKGPVNNTLYKMLRNGAAASTPGGPSESPFEMGNCSVKFDGQAPRIQHREFVGPVFSPGPGFNTFVYRIQPGLMGANVLFPWLSSIAGSFQQYTLLGAVAEYASMSSDFSSSGALGAVMMSTLYDAEATPLASEAEVDNNEYTTVAKPSISFYHPFECDPDKNSTDVRYVRRSNSSVAGQDERFDDVGIFQLSTSGISAPAGTQIGQLWITYDIALIKTTLPDLHAGTSFQADLAGSSVYPTGVLALDPGNSLPATISYGTFQFTVNLPPGYNGNYLVTIYGAAYGGAVTGWGLNPSWGSDISPLRVFPSATLPGQSYAAVVFTTNNYQYSIAISTIASNKANNYINFTYVGTGAVSSTHTVIINAMDNDITATYAKQAELDKKFLAAYARSHAKRATALVSTTLTPPPPSSSAGTTATPVAGPPPALDCAASSAPAPSQASTSAPDDPDVWDDYQAYRASRAKGLAEP